MKIFISHSSNDVNYGNALVDLLTGVDVPHDKIIFTSNVSHGIPIGKNIFDWLKNEIIEKPFVIYLLSSSYYKSVACLNEMGAAWVVENEHVCVFTPDFKLDSPEFQNGAIDPREIGFRLNDEDRVFSFIGMIIQKLDLNVNTVRLNQKVKAYLNTVSRINKEVIEKSKSNLIKDENEGTNPLMDMVNNYIKK